MSDNATIPITIEFSGGLEILFANQKKYDLSLPTRDESGEPATVAFLVRYLCDHIMKDPRKELFVLDDTVRPGILVLINEADWELEGEDKYQVQKSDHIILPRLTAMTLNANAPRGPVHDQSRNCYTLRFQHLFLLSPIEKQDSTYRNINMSRNSLLPPHVDPSIFQVCDVLLGIGGLGYTVCYVLIARQSIRDKTYTMPLFALAFNFAWEIVFAAFVTEEAGSRAIFGLWMLIDLALVYTTVKYGATEWKHAPVVGRNIGKIFFVMLVWCWLGLYAISAWWLDPENPVNPKVGKIYRGTKGVDVNELGFWTSLVGQVVLSIMSLAQIVVRGSSRGSSYSIWATRFIGSLAGLNMNFGYCWWTAPRAHVKRVKANMGLPPESCLPLHPRNIDKFLVNECTMSSDDEDLKLAMAMSLQEDTAGTTENPPASGIVEAIDLSSDTDDEEDVDEDLRRAIALSMQEDEKPNVAQQPASGTITPATVSTASGFMGIDRKAMEQERLARLGKRKRNASPERPSKQVTRSPPASAPSKGPILQYPKGVIKRTFASKYPRTNDITIDELLEAPHVNIAVICSYQYDSSWMYEKLDPTKVKQIWLMYAKFRGEDIREKLLQEWAESRVPNMRLHFPPMDGMIVSMHSKFMLLFGKEKLRIAIPTANMTPTDWGEVGNDWQPGVMENSVFLIDLPRRSDDGVGKVEDLPPFGRDLVFFLKAQEVGSKVTDGVLKFDFADTKHLAFVHSIGGSHKEESERPTGLPGLANAVRELQYDDVEHLELDYAASSLGAINDTFLSRIYLAARGKSFTKDNAVVPDVRDHIRIYFPTNDTVEKSTGGPDCANIISLSRKYYNASTFPKECLRDYVSTRRGMLSHNKLLFARGRRTNGKPFAWVYVGSANISESAWGGQKVLKSGKVGALSVRNWECGVMVPVPDDKLEQVDLKADAVPPMSVFEGTVEVPFHFPGANLMPQPANPSTRAQASGQAAFVEDTPLTVPVHAWFTSPARSHADLTHAKELPLHLIHLILSYQAQVDDVGDIARITRTSRLLYYMMLPRLYEHVTLRSYSEIRYIDGRPEGYGSGSPFAIGLNTLVSRNFGDYIQSFRLRGEWREHDIDDYKHGRVPDNSMVLQIVLRAALDKMKNLKTFAWELNSPPLCTVYQGLVARTSLSSLTIRCQTRRTPRPTTIISPLPNLTTLVVYDIDPLCYPDDISLLIYGSKKLENLKLHWSPRMRAAGEESVNLMSIFGRCVASNYAIPIKRLAIYNLYTRFSSTDLNAVLANEALIETTIINSMGNSDPMTVFTDDSWRVHNAHKTPPNLKMTRIDHFEREGVQVLAQIQGMERFYIVSKRTTKGSSTSDSTVGTPSTPLTNTPCAPASTNGTPIIIVDRVYRDLGSEYIAAIQSSHRTLRHLLLSELWILSDDALFQLAKSLPQLEQFGYACAVPSTESLRKIMVCLPKLRAIRLLLRPGHETDNRLDINDPDLHMFAIATEFWKPEYKNLEYIGIGDDLVFKLGGIYFPPKKDVVTNGNENSIMAKRTGPIRNVEQVTRESVKHVEIWGLDTTEFDPAFP
ncbi:hypothetical protein PTNB73_10490 [Pyrenophora teres f. teres]|nr:hypothetical protein HRS9122_03565 [Pyrenophora teres f. teres]KAE8854293.1 hypothetical protein PTNB73_10490 [Pyrenophora teres f. teres]